MCLHSNATPWVSVSTHLRRWSQGVEAEECLALLTPLLRSIGNMGTSKAASQSLLTAACVAAVQRCAECSHASLRAESQWAMAMLSALAKR